MEPRQSLADVLKVLISVSSRTLIGERTHDPFHLILVAVKSDNSRQEALLALWKASCSTARPFWPNPYRRTTHGPFHLMLAAVKSDNSRQEALLACFMEGVVFNSRPFWVSMKTQCYFLYSFRLEVGKVV
ncbi:hypothetical protein CEXT_213631 [Caerostris extrusa]|uniref:Uncharacterized protein n=1 Tax=Caerostris extrusa TaxID=172846 RepID=A0AAV4MBN5_CAEEX|nr:hypothetical protein CEXT_213631 [Caerostris extrusa]